MKFLRFLCNLCLFLFTTVVISAVQVGAYDIVAAQDNFGLDKNNGSSIEVINVIPSDNSAEFIDTFKFWGTDISTGVKTNAKYRIRSWGDWDWWSSHMKWADVALDSTIAVTKPIFAPIAQVNAMKDYYLTENYTINSVYHHGETEFATDSELYELYVFFTDFSYGDASISNEVVSKDGTIISSYQYALSQDSNKFFSVSADGTYYRGNTEIGDFSDALQYCSDELHFIDWLKEHKTVYNMDWKLQKYNQQAYSRYFKKFIHVELLKDSAGRITEVRTIKSSVVTLYYIQLTSMLIALVFTIKYPVSLLQLKYESGRKKHRAAKEDK